ncbi:hypothetical protein [Deinococcus soli (ex Cha et al. 2016)]|uniref:Uncharacterized protein n=2 Tax=Deinococcus soli (ex Cha et al. 2016) TaxID=1309411 RepID=A0ACC6KKB1_9DEIO|nr:hypothetical protein [Deinococcus soli (ex Cha et al. 2016)]MDR6218567.1 hypothetical protein [Deinococcus soli (ex Cha et al. 2016)]MDR6328364.1 hypothetical protein [Deinococcus soli (ex Cha et al. 2016)]MDR6752975.1 hypothetical protein [Deinococcus soli (ex Cha et al. 2016)]
MTTDTPRSMTVLQKRHVLRRALDTEGLITLTDKGRSFTFLLVDAGGTLTVDGSWRHPLHPEEPCDGDRTYVSDVRMVYQQVSVHHPRGCGHAYFGSDFSEEQIIQWGVACLSDDELIAMGTQTALRSMAQEKSLRRGFYLDGLRAATERGEVRPWEAAQQYENEQARAHGLGQ